MATSSYTTNLRLTLPVQGDLSGSWGNTVNTGITELVDASVAGTVSIALTALSTTLTSADGSADQARYMFLTFTGTPGGAATVICPAKSKLYFVTNSTNVAVTLKTSAGTGISIPVGKRMALYCDATNVLDGTDYLSSITLGTALAATSGGTGQSSYAVGDLVYASTTTALSKLADVATGNALISGGVGVAPSYGKIGLTTHVSGTLGVGNGGTGVTSSTGSGNNVLSTSPSLTTPALAGETFSTSAAVSAAGTTQGTGTALTSDYNIITTAAASSGVVLPTATTGRKIVVVNKGANALNIYPATGGTIDALAANAAISLSVNGVMEFNASSTTQWYSTYNLYTSATVSSGVTSFSAGTTGLTPSTGTTGAITLAGTLAVGNGGTGATTLTGVLKGNGTSAFTAATAGTDFVAPGGALGTPSSGTLTNTTGLPISTGVSGLGTGVATALAVNVGTAGSPVINGGVLGTPSSGTLTNATGLPLTTGVTGTLPVTNGGTGVTASTGTGSSVVLGATHTTFTPSITFAIPGDLAITYGIRQGVYARIGNVVYFTISMTTNSFTYTTASSYLKITGLPVAASSTYTGGSQSVGPCIVTYTKTGYTQTIANASAGSTELIINAIGSGSAIDLLFAGSEIPSGTNKTVYISGFYFV